MIEALTASVVSPQDAAAFLGSQGDPWDSQEDMFMAMMGAAISNDRGRLDKPPRRNTCNPTSLVIESFRSP